MTSAPRKNPDLRRKQIIQQAEKVLRDEGLEDLGVDPIALAERHDILVQAKPDTAPGVSGMLMHVNTTFGILYATHIDNDGFQRFSISHELGHYFLEGHPEHLFSGGAQLHTSMAGFASVDPFEREADYFASGLLMPSAPFERALRREKEGLGAVLSLAGQCRSSLTATAIRYADLTSDAAAVIISQGPAVQFAMVSEAMKGLGEIVWPLKGSALPGRSRTARLNSDIARVDAADRDEGDADLSDWLGGRSVKGYEEVIGLGRYGKTLTVLTTGNLADPTYGADDDDEETLIESWTPRFKK